MYTTGPINYGPPVTVWSEIQGENPPFLVSGCVDKCAKPPRWGRKNPRIRMNRTWTLDQIFIFFRKNICGPRKTFPWTFTVYPRYMTCVLSCTTLVWTDASFVADIYLVHNNTFYNLLLYTYIFCVLSTKQVPGMRWASSVIFLFIRIIFIFKHFGVISE